MNRRACVLLGLLVLALVVPTACSDDNEVLEPPGCATSSAAVPAPAVVRAVPAGDSFSVGLPVPVVVRIENGSDVGSVAFHLRYNSTLLAPDLPAIEGTFLSCDGSATSFLVEPGSAPDELVVVLTRLGGGPGASGTGDLVTIRFTSLRQGRAVVAFTGASVKDPQSQNLPASFLGATILVE